MDSIYIERIGQWQANFSQDNILIIDSSMFFHQTDEIMAQIWQFLNLNAIAPPEHIRYNIGTYPPVKQEIKQQLKDFFAIYNQELSDYLQQKLSWQD